MLPGASSSTVVTLPRRSHADDPDGRNIADGALAWRIEPLAAGVRTLGMTFANASTWLMLQNVPAESDPLLLRQRLRARDEAALAEVYGAHSAAVYGVLLGLLDQGAAQEVLQDVFLKLWEQPQAFDPGRGSLRVYLLVMARSRALDRLRQRKTLLPLLDEEGQELPVPDERPGAVHFSEQRTQREVLRRALAGLSEGHRETVRRAFLRGESREEIAAAMNVPVGTVKSRLSYALKYLRAALGEEGMAWLD